MPTCALHRTLSFIPAEATNFLTAWFAPGTATDPRERQKGKERHALFSTYGRRPDTDEESLNQVHGYKQ